jgi:hypothetical protein
MRPGLAALSACLLAAAPALAQQSTPPGPFPTSPTVPAPAGESYFAPPATDPTPLDAAVTPVRGGGWHLYGGADYLAWYITPMNTPGLIQTVPTALTPATNGGTLPAGSTRQFFPDRRDLRLGRFDGARATVGVGYNDWGLEATGYYLDRNTRSEALFNSGTPFAIGQPYVSAATGTSNVLFSSLAGQYSGGTAVTAASRQWGLEANVRIPWYALFTDWTDLLLGFRYADLDEGLSVSSQAFFPDGSTFSVSDTIKTRNRFYGPQIGLHGRIGACDRGFGLEVLTKLAMGGVEQTVNLNGSNTFTVPGQGSDTQAGGLYARGTNFGTFRRGHFAVMPELNVNLTYNFNPRAQVYAGYSLMWLSSVARPGEQIDLVVNEGAVRFIANGTQANVARPTFGWRANELWTQGVNFGVKFQY